MSAESHPVRSAQIHDTNRVAAAHGDTWSSAATGDGTVYVLSCDTQGFAANLAPLGVNLAISKLRIDGSDVHVDLVNPMLTVPSHYGLQGEMKYDADGGFRMWKGNSLAYIDDVMYLSISRHGDMTPASRYIQDARNASIIKSLDYGLSWERVERQNYLHPMFPNDTFSVPFFVQYGTMPVDGQSREVLPDGAEDHVYAISNDGYWNNGNWMKVGRVPRGRLSQLDPSDWEWFCADVSASENAESAADAWSADPTRATQVLLADGQLSQSGIQYLWPLRRYVMLQWFYPSPYKGNFDTSRTVWRFYEAPKPWGPWTSFFEQEFDPTGFYNPEILVTSVQAEEGGARATVLTAGDWRTNMEPDSAYRLQLVDVTFRT